MDPIWITVAFVLGFIVKQMGLPPLIGFLAAGFVLRAFGVSSTESLQQLGDLKDRIQPISVFVSALLSRSLALPPANSQEIQ